MLSRWARNIRSRKTPFYATAYSLADAIRKINVPPIKFIYIPMYHFRKGFLSSIAYFLQKFIYEPMFKARCVRCGKGLRILHGIPILSDHLSLYVGNNVTINGIGALVGTTVNETPVIEIGDGTIIGYECVISAGLKVTIGTNCMIAHYVFIADNYGHPTDPVRRLTKEKVSSEDIKPISIGNNVWIGFSAFIGRGVTIGDGAIIGANSCVLSNVAPNHVVVGNPARTVRVLQTNNG